MSHMEKENFISKLAAYEEQIVDFVCRHQQEIKQNWSQWLAESGLKDQIMSLIGDLNELELIDVKKFEIIFAADRLDFRELPPPNASHSTLQSYPKPVTGWNAKGEQSKLQLERVGYRLVSDNSAQSFQLCIDYYIIKITTQKIASQRTNLPLVMPQQTFMEARQMAMAISDGPSLIGWEELSGEIGLRHFVPGETMQTRLIPGPLLKDQILPYPYESLRNKVKGFELASVLLLNVAIGSVLQKPQMTVSIDDLIGLVGWTPRSRVARDQMRKKIWDWLQLFDAMTVHGRRPGTYRDKLTKREYDLTSEDALIKVTGRRFETSIWLADQQAVPLEVSWVAGPWLEKWRGNGQILQYFGDIRKIAAISAGKASGAWAQSIGLALNQYWREGMRRAKVNYGGEDNKLTVRFEPFTRYQLLSLFRAQPWVEDVLNSDKPYRARRYWDEAIKKLKVGGAGIIGYYKELDAQPERRKGWDEFWLRYQLLDIRPREEGLRAAIQISRSAARTKSR